MHNNGLKEIIFYNIPLTTISIKIATHAIRN